MEEKSFLLKENVHLNYLLVHEEKYHRSRCVQCQQSSNGSLHKFQGEIFYVKLVWGQNAPKNVLWQFTEWMDGLTNIRKMDEIFCRISKRMSITAAI